ncbi:uncharacterized protein DUF397 [Kitasatospora sp. SolWspMP-SS2h]|uniref:DUF397 domain-containing protein n=1 Tax=Kitasatospora sp. SolWspMP-SS2h TaxID=1305729 RepID=UPI000DBA1F74|nr:DUF397 domain-containing protein [Kitasatospora sp. SolWspMP-SS2h]RAJ35319.1 uncharacterized protein DUF397 [Kitasatospora sp. SolWspMP-SS2h]
MARDDPAPPAGRRWRKSSHSNSDGGGCIKVDDAAFGHVRDSKDPHGAHLEFTPTAWAAFVTATATGRFDPA